MMTALEHPLVRDYLDRLHMEVGRLPVDDGPELEAQIREHLAAALPGDPTEVEVREVLDRLGTPVDLVDAAGGIATGADQVPASERQGPWREVGALVCLIASAVLFFLLPVNAILWLAGIVLLVLAPRWSVAEKVWGAVVLGLSPWLVIVAAGAAWVVTSRVCVTDESGTTCSGGSGLTALNVVAIAVTVLWLALYLWTVVRLARAAARRG